MKDIKVLGAGCSACSALTEKIAARAKELGVEAKVEKITDYAVIAGYGVMSVPAVVVDGAVVHAGGSPDQGKIDAWLTSSSQDGAKEEEGCCCCSCGCKDRQ